MTNLKNELTGELTGEQRKALEDAGKVWGEVLGLAAVRHIRIAVAAKSARTLLQRLGYDVTFRQVYQAVFAAHLVLLAVKPLAVKGSKAHPLFVEFPPPPTPDIKFNLNDFKKGNN